MFNTYHFGGYLIERLYPAQKVFVDGRGDLYGDVFLREYMEIAFGAPAWARLFDKYEIDYLVVQRDTPLRQLLLCRGDFKLVYDDPGSSVLVRDTMKYGAVIAKYARGDGDMGQVPCTPNAHKASSFDGRDNGIRHGTPQQIE